MTNRLKKYLTEDSRLRYWINKNPSAYEAFAYSHQRFWFCGICEYFAHPRDGFGECYNKENAEKFLKGGADDVINTAFKRDKSIPVEMAGICPKFKEIAAVK
jgi:hypothetical protein